jgi:RND superfamily putative drug exporter
MSRILYRWGRAAARHPWRMIGVWLVIAVAVLGLDASVGGETSDDWSIPGTEAQQGADVLEQSFPTEGGVAGRIVFADPDGDVTDATARAAIEQTLAAIEDGPSVLSITDPFDPAQPAVSPDGRVAYATVRYSVDPPGPAEGEAALDAI